LLPASGLFFDPKYAGEVFLWNAGWYSTDCTALYPRWQNSLKGEFVPVFI
jgi:hypothetical protein